MKNNSPPLYQTLESISTSASCIPRRTRTNPSPLPNCCTGFPRSVPPSPPHSEYYSFSYPLFPLPGGGILRFSGTNGAFWGRRVWEQMRGRTRVRNDLLRGRVYGGWGMRIMWVGAWVCVCWGFWIPSGWSCDGKPSFVRVVWRCHFLPLLGLFNIIEISVILFVKSLTRSNSSFPENIPQHLAHVLERPFVHEPSIIVVLKIRMNPSESQTLQHLLLQLQLLILTFLVEILPFSPLFLVLRPY